MTTYTYARRWNFLLHREIESISEFEARNIFDTHEGFFIVVRRSPTTGVPIAFLEVGGKPLCVDAYRLDALERVDTAYTFQYIEGEDRLFLSMVSSYGYGSGQYVPRNKADISSTYYFKPDSDAVIVEERRPALAEIRRSEKDGYDLSSNWEFIPAFGDWESLLRFERG